MVLVPPLHVGHPQASVPHPGKRGKSQPLIRAHLLTQAGEREGYGSHNCDVRGVPVAAAASRKLEMPEACRSLSQGSCRLITGPSAVVGCTGSQEGVGSDLCLLTGPLGGSSSSGRGPASGVQGNSCGSHPPLELM